MRIKKRSKVPNRTTQRAMRDAENGKTIKGLPWDSTVIDSIESLVMLDLVDTLVELMESAMDNIESQRSKKEKKIRKVKRP